MTYVTYPLQQRFIRCWLLVFLVALPVRTSNSFTFTNEYNNFHCARHCDRHCDFLQLSSIHRSKTRNLSIFFYALCSAFTHVKRIAGKGTSIGGLCFGFF